MIKLGYHPATFPGEGIEKLAVSLPIIRAEGWHGVEYSARALEPWFDDPATVRRLLDEAGLVFCGIYHPCGFRDDDEVTARMEMGERLADFCVAVGCGLIMIDGGAKTGDGGKAQIERAAAGANEMGRLCARHGLTCSWHQHWGTIFEYQEPFERLLALTDPELVRFTPDTAQLSLGDFDVPEVFRRHAWRMAYVHFKDLGPDRRFIELGRGTVNFPACWEALRGAGFSGWIVVDLDYTALDPTDACRANMAYLRRLGVRPSDPTEASLPLRGHR